jgi:hypothetical protein
MRTNMNIVVVSGKPGTQEQVLMGAEVTTSM